MEIELKLDLAEADPAALLGSGLLPGPPEVAELRAVYFDTPDRALARAGLSLRIRRSPQGLVQTLKAAQGAAVGLFARAEWEQPATEERPVIAPGSPAEALIGDHAAGLAPVFRVEVERRIWIVDWEGARAEVALDQGEIIAADRRTPVRELEIELREGAPEALFAWVRRVAEVVPVRLGVIAKSERGERLRLALPAAHKAEPVALTREMTAAEAFRAIGLSCLRQFRLNEDLLRAGGAAEALHQARVALRRLRSAFAIFRPAGARPDALREDLRWLAGVLGEARDLDVLLSRAGPGPLHAPLAAAREAAYARVAAALDGPRARGLLLDLAEWLVMREALPKGGGAEPARDFARRALERFRRKIVRGTAALAGPDEAARHELRKDAKKLRYATEFLAPLFDGPQAARRQARFARALEALQERLGTLNDRAAAPALLEALGLAEAPGAAELLAGGGKRRLIRAALAAQEELTAAKRFWR